MVERAMRALPEREQQIIRLRFGAELSQAEIGNALGGAQHPQFKAVSALVQERMKQIS